MFVLCTPRRIFVELPSGSEAAASTAVLRSGFRTRRALQLRLQQLLLVPIALVGQAWPQASSTDCARSSLPFAGSVLYAQLNRGILFLYRSMHRVDVFGDASEIVDMWEERGGPSFFTRS